MRRIVARALIFGFISAFSVVSVGADSRRGKNLAVFDEVWGIVKERYYDADLRGIDWNAKRADLREKSAAAQNQVELYRILREMLAALRDSHTRVFAPSENSDWTTPLVVGINVSVREIENQLVVTRVGKKTAPEIGGMRVGDRLTSIDGSPAKEIFEQKLADAPGASTDAIKRLQAAARIFEGAVGAQIKICWRRTEARERCAAFTREARTIKPDLRIKKQNGVLIVGFDVFTLEIISRVLGVLREHQDDLRGIVLDLRQNRGGVTEASVDLASVFLPEKTLIGNFYDRAGKIAQPAETRAAPVFIVNSEKAAKTPLVVLTGTATASAAEIFVAALKKTTRARVVGAETCGCVLAVKRQHRLPDGGALEISELDFRLANGDRLEGVGVAPDEKTALTIEDVRAGRDRALEKALESFKNAWTRFQFAPFKKNSD